MTTEHTTLPTFWDTEPEVRDWPPFMDTDIKARIAAEGLIFDVASIRDAETTHGPTWMLEVTFEGERWTIALSHTEHRDAQLTRMQAHLDAHGPVTCGLETVTGKHGMGWVLTAPTGR